MLQTNEFLRLINELYNTGNNETELRRLIQSALNRGAAREQIETAIFKAFSGHPSYKSYTSAGQDAKEAEESAKRILESLGG